MSSHSSPIDLGALPHKDSRDRAASRDELALAVLADQLVECIHCGLCLEACPTYLEIAREEDSPRGRIYLMRAIAEGRSGLDSSVLRHLDVCLGCRACETACPS
ncbi:MAG: 4Fe-4S dicluster domain-containing protein, partial [Armatimonadota bacterium]